MTKKFFSLYFLFLLLVQPVAAIESEQLLRIHGSNTIGATLAPQLVRQWLHDKGYHIRSERFTAKEEREIIAVKQQQMLRVEIHAHGSSTAFRDFAKGLTDVGMASRRIKEQERKALMAYGDLMSHQSERVIALDGLAILVNKNNPLQKIDKVTLKKIFSGKIRNWKQLGLHAAPIHVYARDNNSGTYDTFRSLVLGKKTSLIKTAKRFESNQRLSASVAADINAIGFTGVAYIGDNKAVAIHDNQTRALKPNVFTIATEDYLLARRLFMYVPQNNPHPLAREFADYVVSEKADTIVTRTGFVSQEISAYRVAVPSQAPDEYRQYTTGASRLSINIRFHSGSTKLDNKARQDIQRLVKFLQRPENSFRKLLLFGFADKHEVIPFMSTTFSVSRADAVASYLAKFRIFPIRVRGYGHAMPVASNETRQGRFKNRRVEIWMM